MGVPINDAVSLLAAASLCPHLKKVGFSHKPLKNPVSLATLGTIFKSWSKVLLSRILFLNFILLFNNFYFYFTED